MAESQPILPVCEDNRGPSLLALAWTLQAIAIITVSLRIWLRSGLRNGISWDDYFIVASLVNTNPDHSFTTTLMIARLSV